MDKKQGGAIYNQAAKQRQLLSYPSMLIAAQHRQGARKLVATWIILGKSCSSKHKQNCIKDIEPAKQKEEKKRNKTSYSPQISGGQSCSN
jgi:hypothetical protein